MGSENSALLAQLRAARTLWVEIAEGKAIQLLRPLEADAVSLIRNGMAGELGLEDVKRCAIGWRGVTEADLVGKGVGSDDAVPFDAEVLAEALGDNIVWLEKAINGLSSAVLQRMEARVAAKGNSPATSTHGSATATVASST